MKMRLIGFNAFKRKINGGTASMLERSLEFIPKPTDTIQIFLENGKGDNATLALFYVGSSTLKLFNYEKNIDSASSCCNVG